MFLVAIKPKSKEAIEFEIAHNNRIVDVVYHKGEVKTDNKEVKAFVIKKVLPYLPFWIGWRWHNKLF